MKIKTLQSFTISILFLYLAGGTASACPGYYVTTTNYETQVTATGVVDSPDPGGGLRITINLHNPGNTVSDNDDSGENFYSYSVPVNVYVNKGNVDGTYVATTQNYSYAWPGAPAFWLGQGQSNKQVDPWVQIVRTSLAKTTMAKVNDTNTFTVYLATSTNCSGNVSVSSVLTRPSGMQVEIQNDSGIWSVSALKSVPGSMPAGSTANIDFPIRTTNTNSVSGSVTSSASFNSWPGSCSPRDPDSASTYSKTLTFTVSP